MVSLIDEHREKYGVEPICSQLPIPSLGADPVTQRNTPHHRRWEGDSQRSQRTHPKGVSPRVVGALSARFSGKRKRSTQPRQPWERLCFSFPDGRVYDGVVWGGDRLARPRLFPALDPC
jgi:hypothetical protein